MSYKALTFINLPNVDIKKMPGDEITSEELKQAGQTKEDIKALVDGGSLSTDMDAPLHPDNQPVTPPDNPTADMNVSADDEGKGGAE